MPQRHRRSKNTFLGVMILEVEKDLSITVGKQGGEDGDMQISSLSFSLILNPRKLPGASGGE